MKKTANAFRTHQLPNGITLVAEQMDFVSSVAFSILVPFGAATDPAGEDGMSSILVEMLSKGAGPWSSRELSEKFDNLGLQRSHVAGIEVSVFSGALLGENLDEVLAVYNTLLRKPLLPADELESVRQLALQDLRSLEDEPSSKVMEELARVFYPHPFGRSQLGTVDGLNKIGIEALKRYSTEQLTPQSVIISVAGQFDWDKLRSTVEKEFGTWSGTKQLLSVPKFTVKAQAHHVQKETNQVQLALAHRSVALEHPDYYVARIASSILSGSMAGRLFVEVREKRGLVYSVSSSHSAARGRGAVFTYAGTTPKHADECLTVVVGELRRLGEGVTEDELSRAKTELKARVIMHGESTSVRASSLVNDYWSLGRLRTLDEIQSAIDAVTNDDIKRHLKEFPPEPLTMVTLGDKPMELPK